MVYTCYDKIYTVLGIGHAPPCLPGPRAPPAWYQALPEQAQKACLLGALLLLSSKRQARYDTDGALKWDVLPLAREFFRPCVAPHPKRISSPVYSLVLWKGYIL